MLDHDRSAAKLIMHGFFPSLPGNAPSYAPIAIGATLDSLLGDFVGFYANGAATEESLHLALHPSPSRKSRYVAAAAPIGPLHEVSHSFILPGNAPSYAPIAIGATLDSLLFGGIVPPKVLRAVLVLILFRPFRFAFGNDSTATITKQRAAAVLRITAPTIEPPSVPVHSLRPFRAAPVRRSIRSIHSTISTFFSFYHKVCIHPVG